MNISALRFAEAVCAGHPDKLADTIASRIVELACARDNQALVGIEVALHRGAVFVDGPIAAGEGESCVVAESDVVSVVRQAFRDAGYGGRFPPEPDTLEIRLELCLGPLGPDQRARHVSDDQAIAVGYARRGKRAGYRPLEQALATDFARALERLRRTRPELGLGPDGKTLVVVRGTRLVGVSLSVHHLAGAEWLALTEAARQACLDVAAEYVEAGELNAPQDVDWLINGAGAFEVGGPSGDNGLSGKKLVADAYGASVPIGGGAVHGKDPLKVDPAGQARARQMALDIVLGGEAEEATVWLAWRPGDTEPHWTHILTS